MPQIDSWTYSGASPTRDLRLQAASVCAGKLPEPHNYATHLVRQGRMARLETELAEFDFRYRLARGTPASFEELVCMGTLLIESCRGTFPLPDPAGNEDLLVNRNTLPVLVRWMEQLLGNDAEARQPLKKGPRP